MKLKIVLLVGSIFSSIFENHSAIWFVRTRIRLYFFVPFPGIFGVVPKIESVRFTHAFLVLSHLESIFTGYFILKLLVHRYKKYAFILHIIYVMNPIFGDNIELLRVHWCAKFVSLKTARGLTKKWQLTRNDFLEFFLQDKFTKLVKNDDNMNIWFMKGHDS